MHPLRPQQPLHAYCLSGKVFQIFSSVDPLLKVTEEDLIAQLLEIVDRIDVNNFGMKEKLEKEIERYGDFRSKVLEMNEEEKIVQSRLNIRGYMKYILQKGAVQEKRELMQSFTSKLILINKRVVLECN